MSNWEKTLSMCASTMHSFCSCTVNSSARIKTLNDSKVYDETLFFLVSL